MHRRVLLLVAFLVALPLFAQSPRLISKIDVRGGVPAKIVLSQLALTPGRSYSDADVENAVARVRRLPFVFDARSAIEGETLVVEVEAVRRFFADVDATGSGYENDETGSASLGGGGRLFVGANGVAEAHVSELVAEGGADLNIVDAGYSHYGIAGTRLFATAAVSQTFRNDHGFDPDPTWSVLVGYPLTVRQTVTGTFTDEGYEARQSFAGSPMTLSTSGNRTTWGLRWTWDTSNDPYFARHGLTVSAGPAWSDESVQFDGILIGFPGGDIVPAVFRSETTTRSLGVDARKYWATGTRGALLAAVAASRIDFDGRTTQSGLPGELRSDANVTAASLTAGYGHNLFDWNARPELRQRVELGATYTRQWLDAQQDVTLDGTIVNAAYVLRHPFATVRLNLFYAFDNAALLAQQAPAEPVRR